MMPVPLTKKQHSCVFIRLKIYPHIDSINIALVNDGQNVGNSLMISYLTSHLLHVTDIVQHTSSKCKPVHSTPQENRRGGGGEQLGGVHKLTLQSTWLVNFTYVSSWIQLSFATERRRIRTCKVPWNENSFLLCVCVFFFLTQDIFHNPTASAQSIKVTISVRSPRSSPRTAISVKQISQESSPIELTLVSQSSASYLIPATQCWDQFIYSAIGPVADAPLSHLYLIVFATFIFFQGLADNTCTRQTPSYTHWKTIMDMDTLKTT